MSNDINDPIDLQALCDVLVKDHQATYIAAPEQTLANQSPVLLFHVPAGTQRLSELRGNVAHHLEGVDGIRLGEYELPFSLRHVLHSDVHEFRRVPLYADSQPGMDDVLIEEGIEQARQVVAGEIEPDAPASESIELLTLVEELADAGAVAVELRNEPLIELGIIDLRIPMIPADGHPIAGPCESVIFDGKTYDFRFNCVLEDPCGYRTMRTPLYIDGSTHGLPELPVHEGLAHFKDVQLIIEEIDSSREAYKKLRDVVPAHG